MDILPYVIASAAANTGSTDLVLTAGVAQDSTDGWPALPGDLCMAFGGTGGTLPAGITTSRGDTLTKVGGVGTTPALSAWTAVLGSNGLKAAGPGVTADTIDVNYTGTGQAKQWAIIGCQGLGTVDTAAFADATGTGTAVTVTSGTPAGAGEIVFAAVAYQNGGNSFNWGSGWIPLASDINVGANSFVSVAYKVNSGSGTVVASGTLGASVGWQILVMPVRKATTLWSQVNPSNGRAIVGASIFKAAYPGEVTTDAQARSRFDSIVGRKAAGQGQKRYLDESQYESQANQYQSVVSLTQSGINCLVSIKPRRAIGGGVSSEIPLLRNMLIYWKNNGVAPHTLLGNEATINGQHGPMGDGTQKDWNLPTPYTTTTTLAQTETNYHQYHAFYGPTIVKAGLQCFYNPAISSVNSSVGGIPARLQASGRPLCTGITVDLYMIDTSQYYPNGPNNKPVASDPYKVTLDSILTPAAAASPQFPVGIGETGFTDGTPRPQTTNPAGTAQWITEQLQNKLSPLKATDTLLPVYWFANGTGNTIDTGIDSRIVTAYQGMYDTLDPSGAGGGTLLVITTGSLPATNVGQNYLFSLGATGGTPPYTWSIQTGTLQAGLSLSTSGVISGTVGGAAGTNTVTYKVTDNVGATATVSLSIVVGASFTFTGSALPATTVGSAYSQNLATGVSGGASPIAYALDPSALVPDGLTLSTAGVFSGTVAATAAGPPGSPATNYSFPVIATDNTGATATATFTISVSNPAPIVFPPVTPDYPVTVEMYDDSLNALFPVNYETLSAQLFYNMVGSWQITMAYDDNVWQQVKSGTTIFIINWRGLFEFGGKCEVPGYANTIPAAATGFTTGPGEQLVLGGADYMAMIANRIAFPNPAAAWTAQTATSKTTYTGHCETIIKSLISDNGGPTGQSGRRITIMDIATDLARGAASMTRDIAFVQGADLNLMDIIRSLIGTGGPLGVSLKRNGQRLTFDCFVPNDLTQSVGFSASLGNMPSVSLSLTDPTCTIAFSQSSVTGSNFQSASVSSDQWSRTEQFVDQSGQTQQGNVSQAMNDAINQGAAQPALTSVFTDIPNMTFGKDYWLGDKVTVEIRPGDTYQDIVSSVSLTVDPSQSPAISVNPQIGYASDPGALDPGFSSQLLNRVRRLERRLNAQRG